MRRPCSVCPICCWPRCTIAAGRPAAGVQPVLSERRRRSCTRRGPGWGVDKLVAAQTGELMALLRSRHTQTNEIGRCAVLWPALARWPRAAGSGAWRCWTSAAVPASTWASTAIASTMAPSCSVLRLRLACRPSCATRSANARRRCTTANARRRCWWRARASIRRRWTCSTPPRCDGCAPAFGPTTASAPHGLSWRWRLHSASALP